MMMTGLSLPRHPGRKQLHELLPLDPRYKRQMELVEERSNKQSRDGLTTMLDRCRLELNTLVRTDWAVERAVHTKLTPLAETTPKPAETKQAPRRHAPKEDRKDVKPKMEKLRYVTERHTVVETDAAPPKPNIRHDILTLKEEISFLEGRRMSDESARQLTALRSPPSIAAQRLVQPPVNAPASPPREQLSAAPFAMPLGEDRRASASEIPPMPSIGSPQRGQVVMQAKGEDHRSTPLDACAELGLVSGEYVASRRAEQEELREVLREQRSETDAGVEAERVSINTELDALPRHTPARWKPRPAVDTSNPPPPTLGELMEGQRKDLGDAQVDNEIFRYSCEMNGINQTMALNERVEKRAYIATLQKEIELQRDTSEALRMKYEKQIAIEAQIHAQKKTESRIRRHIRQAESRALQYDRNMYRAQRECKEVSDEVERARRELQLLEHEDRWFPASERAMAAEERRLAYLLNSAASKGEDAQRPQDPVCRYDDVRYATTFPRSQTS
eukprot:TRINITY_DN18189_c0_g1_i1.p1 TRINITY_DN18189_c0_g1~~TRINITY_DN18189_c0_g1_i1.p1  ORF type:complete len:504 (+),score=218.30 TRINITY_DN18189_c0_g1_i1:104-1615(+)